MLAWGIKRNDSSGCFVKICKEMSTYGDGFIQKTIGDCQIYVNKQMGVTAHSSITDWHFLGHPTDVFVYSSLNNLNNLDAE